ncbi:copper amine oxidase [Pisolithus orientalis]|uniref:copper amine oxidase n=1 Tax=Pisolithus orientalis TaxID=936130 RepID=UPI0022252EB4|nr:copper amine oxidase [Pisolithus orientalis]KAI6010950.1 copper amine oxidase [Pisolithus orientalis]
MVSLIPSTDSAAHVYAHNKVAEVHHPLDPLTPDELNAVTLTVRKYTVEHTGIKALRFVTCFLLPPPKRAVLAALGIPVTPGGKPEVPTNIVRKAESDFFDAVTGTAYNAVLALVEEEWKVESLERLSEGTQPNITMDELINCEIIVQNDPRIQALAKEVGIEPHQIYADGWVIGWDDRFPKDRRLAQAFLFARFSKHENLYAHPLDFIPVIDAIARKIVRIDFPPAWRKEADGSVKLSAPTTQPLPLSDDAFQGANRPRVQPPLARYEFLPDLMKEADPNYKERDDVKPFHVIQPEGVSFKMHGNVLEWQKWKMHIAYSFREGIVLSTITYDDDGEIRPIFYRLSVAEMLVPYGSPESPHSRKFAFDSGEYGMGMVANELSLGCDCLGKIHYLGGAFVDNSGAAVIVKNVICIHEEDAGVLWKHTDYRPGGRSRTVRSRRLVVSMVCTLANYEYIWNYYFYQDGNVELEIRLTGILQVCVTDFDEPTPHGTTVAPRINAQFHQHIFSLRVDPMLDGLQNSVIESEIMAVDAPTGSKENFAGNAFVVKDRILKSQVEDGARDFDWASERRWRIANLNKTHYSSGKPSSYAIMMKGGAVPLMAKQDSWVARRASFANKQLWVVRDDEGPKGSRTFPSGRYVPQTREEPKDSVGKWVNEGDGSIENEDIVIFLTVGTTHIPRPEDWPVMPVEHINVLFKPSSFFTKNPSMDVPGTNDLQSQPAFDTNGTDGHHSNGTSGTACCAN